MVESGDCICLRTISNDGHSKHSSPKKAKSARYACRSHPRSEYLFFLTLSESRSKVAPRERRIDRQSEKKSLMRESGTDMCTPCRVCSICILKARVFLNSGSVIVPETTPRLLSIRAVSRVFARSSLQSRHVRHSALPSIALGGTCSMGSHHFAVEFPKAEGASMIPSMEEP